MLIVIQDDIIIATHDDNQNVSGLYPAGTDVKKIVNDFPVYILDPDPTLEHPEYEVKMQLFLHTVDRIRIINEGLFPSEFTCSPADFAILEPTYPALPAGATGRYWTPEKNYCMDAQGGQFPEDFDGSVYTAKTDQYAAALPCIYADVQVGSDRLCKNADPADSLTFQAWIKDADGNVLPVSQSWIIRLRDADGEEADAFEVAFANGATPQMSYTCPPEANLGRIHVDESDFNSVTVPGVGTFQVKLLNPVEFTIYRTL